MVENVIELVRKTMNQRRRLYDIEPIDVMEDNELIAVMHMKLLRIKHGHHIAKQFDDLIDLLAYGLRLAARWYDTAKKDIEVHETSKGVTVRIPVKRLGHDHDDVLTIDIEGQRCVVDERSGVFEVVEKPKIIVSDWRYVEVMNREKAMLQKRELYSQGSKDEGM